MTIDDFLLQLKQSPETVEFADTMAVIEDYYIYTPTRFSNGSVINEAGQNEGSCKLFAFARLLKFDEQQTLACFGRYYRDDVLKHPEAEDHANIRQFMLTGWPGIAFAGEALQAR
jgi:hypothetical protein